MIPVTNYPPKLPPGFKLPSWDRVLVYFFAIFIVCWSVGPFLWQMSTSDPA